MSYADWGHRPRLFFYDAGGPTCYGQGVGVQGAVQREALYGRRPDPVNRGAADAHWRSAVRAALRRRGGDHLPRRHLLTPRPTPVAEWWAKTRLARVASLDLAPRRRSLSRAGVTQDFLPTAAQEAPKAVATANRAYGSRQPVDLSIGRQANLGAGLRRRTDATWPTVTGPGGVAARRGIARRRYPFRQWPKPNPPAPSIGTDSHLLLRPPCLASGSVGTTSRICSVPTPGHSRDAVGRRPTDSRRPRSRKSR